MQHIWKKEDTKFIERTFNGHSKVRIPHFQRLPGNRLAEGTNEDIPYEPARCASMEERLKKGDVLFDIGVADGWMSAIYASFVGADSLCMFEPTAAVWANIKTIWDANKLANPLYTFWGFVSDTTWNRPSAYVEGWPASAYGSELMEEMQFRSLLSTGHEIPQITVDDFVSSTNIVPRGISIDVEGAEFLVLKGARQTLVNYKPLIWLSLHDINGALTYDYRSNKEEVFEFLTTCGYKMTWLENYGDSHWLCECF